MSEEESPPVGIDEEEEPSPASLPSRPSRGREEEWCSSGLSFSPFAYVREEEWCGSSLSFPPRDAREEKRCDSREKQTSRSGLRPASSRAPSVC
jgi:hypothetical protein